MLIRVNEAWTEGPWPTSIASSSWWFLREAFGGKQKHFGLESSQARKSSTCHRVKTFTVWQSKILILFFVDTHETIFTDLFADHWIRNYGKVWQQSLEEKQSERDVVMYNNFTGPNNSQFVSSEFEVSTCFSFSGNSQIQLCTSCTVVRNKYWPIPDRSQILGHRRLWTVM